MKQNMKSIVLTALLVALLFTATAFASEEESLLPSKTVSLLQSTQILETDTIPLQVMENSVGITAIVRNFAELKAALNSEDVVGAYIFNNIQMEEALIISKDFYFDSIQPHATTIYGPFTDYDTRHFILRDCELDLGPVILSGSGMGGGLLAESGFVTVRNGLIEDCNTMTEQGGGGMLCLTDTTLFNVTFERNFTSYGGGAVSNGPGGQSLTIEDCTLVENLSGYLGGGIYSASPTTVTNTRFSSNSAPFHGAGIYSENDLFVESCSFSNNIAHINGGGIYHTNPQGIRILTVSRSEFEFNEAANGGGIYLTQNAPSIINATRLCSNSAGNDGGAIGLEALDWSLSVFEDVIFEDNIAAQGFYMTDPDDIALHNQQILTNHFTAPFTYGYNNYDISYTKGININEGIERTVDFYLGKSEDEAYASVGAAPGAVLPGLPEIPARNGYQFVGWYEADGDLFTGNEPITENRKVYAAWIIL